MTTSAKLDVWGWGGEENQDLALARSLQEMEGITQNPAITYQTDADMSLKVTQEEFQGTS